METKLQLRSLDLYRSRYSGRDSRVRLRVLARTWHHGGVLLHNLGHLLAKRVLRDDRPLLLAGAAVPRVEVAGRTRRMLGGCVKVGGRLAGRLVGFGVAAERTLLRAGRVLAAGAAATRRSHNATG